MATIAHRPLTLRRLILNQAALALVILMLYTTARGDGTVDHGVLETWVLVAAGFWVLSLVMHGCVFRVRPEAARSPAARLIPPALSSTSTLFWLWSIPTFVQHEMNMTVAMLAVSFVALGIGMGSMGATRPATAARLTLLGSAVALRWMLIHGMHPSMALALVSGVAAMLWLAVGVPVMLVRPHLQRTERSHLLSAKLQRRVMTLTALKEESWNTLQRRSAFFAGASHDFKQRLHGMKVLTHSTLVDLPADDRSRAALTRLAQEVSELDRYFTEVLEFARMETLDMNPQRRRVELVRVFQEVELNFENVAADRHLRLRFRLTRAWLETDPAMLQRMLENLVSNALKFTRSRVLVAARQRGGSTVIEVWDEGPGIRASEIGKIFEAFHQDGTVPEGGRGIGLGLAVVKRFADCLGYRVTVETRLGRGSVFRIHMPSRTEPTTDS